MSSVEDPNEARHWMARALALAERGRHTTAPNPMVGAVVASGDRSLGEGFHVRAGDLHAERHALHTAGRAAEGADLYVTLEPCCHTGRTPPCTEAIAEAGIARVFVGARDPNPRVAGGGIQRLRDAGIEVVEGVLEPSCRALNEAFEHWMRTGRPLVALKLATTLDGRIATATGASRWITGPEARRRGHELRAELGAVLVGAGTAEADDPRLTAREVPAPGGQPRRVLADSQLRVPLDARLFRDAEAAPPTVATAAGEEDPKVRARREAGAEVLSLPGDDGRVDLAALLDRLGAAEPTPTTALLVEGGGTLAATLLQQGLVDRLHLFLAPSLIGGDGVPALGSLGVTTPDEAPRVTVERIERVGEDLEIVARPAATAEAAPTTEGA